MRPSWFQLFFAHHWPEKLSFAASVLAGISLSLSAVPGLDSLSIMGFAWTIAAIPVGGLLGLFVGSIAGCIVLPPMFWLRIRLNGGPFAVGDKVYIIAGPHAGGRGRINHVHGERLSASVLLDGEGDSTGELVDQVQLVRAQDSKAPEST